MAKRAAVKLNIPPVLFVKTQKIVEAIEAESGATFVSYWNSSSGSVCHNDVLGFYEVLQRLGPRPELVLFIKSDGGTGTASLRIVNLLRQYGRRLRAVLPLECASAATMIALGADEIQMGPLAYLTAVDTSISHDLSPTDVHNNLVAVSQDELLRVVDLWRRSDKASADKASADKGSADKASGADAGSKDAAEPAAAESNPYASLFPYVHPLVIGAVDRSSSLSVMLCTEILRFHMKDDERAAQISAHLNSAYPSHGYPILRQEAQRIGLEVRELEPRLNDMLLDLHELYSEMGQRALTDFDELNYHDNEILNIIECVGMQVYFQTDKDWHYRTEERRWVSLNDKSSWRKVEQVGGRTVRSIVHIR
jgi:hypothetical protein